MNLVLFTLILALSGTEAFAMNGDSIRTEVICEEGYKFLIVWSSQGSAPTVEQIMETPMNRIDLTPQPMKCDK